MIFFARYDQGHFPFKNVEPNKDAKKHLQYAVAHKTCRERSNLDFSQLYHIDLNHLVYLYVLFKMIESIAFELKKQVYDETRLEPATS